MRTYLTMSKLAILFLNFCLAAALEDASYWNSVASNELKESLSYSWNKNVAKNVILFIGDGMSVDTITASRIYHQGETSYLAWEKMPHVGMIKTYNTDKMVPDSASTATALFSGVKTNYKVIGVDNNVALDDCDGSLNPDFHTKSIIEWAQESGKDTGFVTTTRVTHATPAPLYAHTPNRNWECEAKIPAAAKGCKDIARQLIEDSPGKNIKVIMGGGRQMLKSNASGTKIDPIDTWACYSQDGRHLMEDWASDKSSRKFRHQIVQNNEQLRAVDPDDVDFLLGVFANGHLNMDWQRVDAPEGQPSLEEMTIMAIRVLRKAAKGFLLVVEGGLIDFAHHRGKAAQALRETVRLSDAVNATLEMVDLKDTLVIVTSDHSHSMAFNGYPNRNSSILGIAQNSKYDGIPYTTLSYNTGGPNNFAYEVKDNKSVRIDPSKYNTFDFNYSQQAAFIGDEAYHGGGDVPIYATGPYAHLFHSTHEQNYVAHVIGYAAQIGPYNNVYFHVFDLHHRLPLDPEINLKNWIWITPKSWSQLESKIECVARLYAKRFWRKVQFYGNEVDVQFDWNVTKNENVADIGALQISYQTWYTLTNGRDRALPVLDALRPSQMFFISAAQTYCTNMTAEAYILSVELDYHTPSPERVNVVMMNSPGFAEAFRCPLGSRMNPPNKCSTW